MIGIPIPYEHREEWLHERRRGLGASDIAKIAGISPWGSAYQVWAEKTGRLIDDEANEQMRWGSRFEGVVIDAWEDQSGLFTIHRQGMFHHPAHRWARATVDGLACESPHSELIDVIGVVEAKTQTTRAWDDIPSHYETQVQWQLFVTGLEQAWMPVLHFGRTLRVYEVEADARLQQQLVDIAGEFWEEFVVGDREPPAVGSDNQALQEVHPGDVTVAPVLASDELEDYVRRLRNLKEQEKTVKRDQQALEAAIKQALGDSTSLVDETGRELLTWRPQHRAEYMVAAKDFRVLRLKEVRDE